MRRIVTYIISAGVGMTLALAILLVGSAVALATMDQPVGMADDGGPMVTRTLPHFGSCEEDEPCWDCSTMGNRICGVSSTTSSHP